MELWKTENIPGFWGIHTRRLGTEFDLVAVSNSVTQEMGNLVWFLKSSGFPLDRHERLEREDLPLVLMGGANAPFATILHQENSLVDGIYLGEGRAELEAFFNSVAQGRAAGYSKKKILNSLAKLPGFFQPGNPSPVVKSSFSGGLDGELLASMPVSYGEGNPGKAVLAISRGCAGFCSFCAESFAHKPYQETNLDTMKSSALTIKASQGAFKLDLFSYNFNMHKDFYPLLEFLSGSFKTVGLKSQRFDSIAADPRIAEVEKLLGKTWFTCGLEGISDRIRRYLNKNLNQDQVRRGLTQLARTGIRELKVFLIATGQETEPDFVEFRSLLEFIRTLPTPSGRPLKVIFSMTPLVRFPHTPQEGEGYGNPKVLEKVMKETARHARELGFESRVAAELSETVVSERLLRPGAPYFYETWVKTLLDDSFVYYDEMPSYFLRHWNLALAEKGWTDGSEPPWQTEGNLPWAHIDLGIRHSYLKNQQDRNRKFQEIHPDHLIRTELASVKILENLRKNLECKKIILSFEVVLTARSAAAGREMTAAALARAVMLNGMEWATAYQGFSGTHWSPSGEDFCLLEGRDIFHLEFAPSVVPSLTTWPGILPQVNEEFSPFGSCLGLVGQENPVPLSQPQVEIASSEKLDWGGYFLSKGMKHTLVKKELGVWSLDFTPQALKKDWLQKAEIRQNEDSWACRLVPGSKWDWKEMHFQFLNGQKVRWKSL